MNLNKPFKHQFPNLCAPLRIRKVSLRNRMASAPVGFPDITEDGCITDGAIAFYERKAKGGACVVTISEALPDYEHGNSHDRMLNLQNPGALSGLTNAARAIQRHGALACIEFGHSGALVGSGMDSLEKKVSVCTPQDFILNFSKNDMKRTIENYRRGAQIIRRAGFDIIMLHAGHGWLLHQFLSPAINKRTDEYGGTIENRTRFILELIDAVREGAGPDMLLNIRMSATESTDGGLSIADSIAFAKLIESKVDIIHVSNGGIGDFYETHPPMFYKSGVNIEFAAEIKKNVNIPISVVGAINDPDEMEEIISSGKADIVCMARALMADPDLPQKVMQNRHDEIVHCLRCLVCHAERAMTQTRICALNPIIGREYEAKYDSLSPTPKRVLVVGGGPGGMQCALTAAQRGHMVTLCEKSHRLGGSLNCEINVPFKSAFPRYIAAMTHQLERAGVKINLSTEVSPEYVKDFQPDALMVAVGAEPLVLPIPGIHGKNVVLVTELDTQENQIGHRVVVLGGGLAGCECGLYLSQKGHEVTIVEMRADVAMDANIRHRPILKQLLEKNTTICAGYTAKAVTDEGLVCMNPSGREVLLKADTVISASGMRPRTELVDQLRGLAPIVSVFGDCVKPSIIRGATFSAYHAALDL